MAGTIYCLPNLIADGTLEAAIPPAVVPFSSFVK